MLSLHNITLQVGREPEPQTLLDDISLQIPAGHLCAIIGPAGSGKSTLVKVITGLYTTTDGTVRWAGRDLAEEDLAPGDIGYVPQFSIAYDNLTVHESMDVTYRLRVSGLSREERAARIEATLNEVGIAHIMDRRVKVLSGGEKRRLGMAMELVSQPSLLIADEVTSGLDAKAEEDIVQLMRSLARQDKRIVLSVTHNLRHLAAHDSVILLSQGQLVFHGTPAELLEYFGVDSAEEVFQKLAEHPPETWGRVWRQRAAKLHPPVSKEPDQAKLAMPNPVMQLLVLLQRRWMIFFRDGSQVWLQLALMFGFPCLVVIFALDGLPQIKNMSMTSGKNVVQELRESLVFTQDAAHVGGLVSGLIMVQVILLTLIGSNNSAREIAGERLIYEKEKLAGLSPFSYLVSKMLFLFTLVTAQSVWMAVFVNLVCRFPGDFGAQILLLMLVNGAMTAVCLAISSWMRSAEQASLVSIYLVGFQLPLSGAVLGLPEFARWLTRPFIAAYWSWSGMIQTMHETRFYDVVQKVSPTDLSVLALCFWVLIAHVFIGLVAAYLGCKQSRWE